MTNDAALKMKMLKLFWSWGFFCQPEVRLVYPEGSQEVKTELTDIDVFALSFGPDLSQRRLVADCKTSRSKNLSPINRALTVSGVMDLVGADHGYVILEKTVGEDHKAAATSLRITLLDEAELDIFVSKLAGSSPKDEPHLFTPQGWSYFEGNLAMQKKVESLLQYRKYRFWIDTPQHQVRYALMDLRNARSAFDQQNLFHQALVLDYVTMFCIGFLRAMSQLFHLHLVSDDKAQVDSYLKAFIYGGREQYQYQNKLRQTVLRLKESASNRQLELEQEIPDLSLPEWDSFLSLYRECAENPQKALPVPRILRFVLFERLIYPHSKSSFQDCLPECDVMNFTLALRFLSYVQKAASLSDNLLKGPVGTIEQAIVEASTH